MSRSVATRPIAAATPGSGLPRQIRARLNDTRRAGGGRLSIVVEERFRTDPKSRRYTEWSQSRPPLFSDLESIIMSLMPRGES